MSKQLLLILFQHLLWLPRNDRLVFRLSILLLQSLYKVSSSKCLPLMQIYLGLLLHKFDILQIHSSSVQNQLNQFEFVNVQNQNWSLNLMSLMIHQLFERIFIIIMKNIFELLMLGRCWCSLIREVLLNKCISFYL